MHHFLGFPLLHMPSLNHFIRHGHDRDGVDSKQLGGVERAVSAERLSLICQDGGSRKARPVQYRGLADTLKRGNSVFSPFAARWSALFGGAELHVTGSGLGPGVKQHR